MVPITTQRTQPLGGHPIQAHRITCPLAVRVPAKVGGILPSVRILCGALAFFCVFAAACGSGNASADELDPNRVEDFIFGAADVFGEAMGQLVDDCLVRNGSEPVPTIEPIELDPAPGLDGADRAKQVGTGLVELQRLSEEMVEATDATDPAGQPNTEQLRLLYTGPVFVPEDDLQANAEGEYEGGCEQWAAEAALDIPEVQERQKLEELYTNLYDEQLQQTSEEIRALNERWADCMANNGFPGLNEPGDQFDRVNERIQQWLTGAISYEDALEFDRAIGLSGFECYQNVEDGFAETRRQVVERFVDESGFDSDRLPDVAE